MRQWLELRVRARIEEERAALLGEALLELGGRALEERDGWLITHLEAPANPDTFGDELLAVLRAAAGTDELELEQRLQADQDWAETWKRGLEPRRLTERLVVTPSWIPVEAREGEVVLVLDPGMAFGTAEHGTTRGCLRLLDRALAPGQRLLDVGAGSGILGIAAALLGASEVVALEGDPLACEALDENVSANGVEGVVRGAECWATADTVASYAPRDGILANIESGVLRPLLPGFRAALVPGGWLILSGTLDEEWPELARSAEAEGLCLREVDVDGIWRSGWFETEPAGQPA